MERAMQRAIVAIVVVTLICVSQTDAHGRLIEPPSRSSMWRYGFNTIHNYNDNQLSCGGFNMQWGVNGGRCGVCGDPFNGQRENEAGGKYATGTITRHYSEGETITVTLDITKNHGGYFEFRMCPNNNTSRPVTESCLNQNLLRQPNGETRWTLSPLYGNSKFSINLVLPRGLTCSQCVLQWKWNTASSWGCDGGQCGKGLGKQEQFYGCADVGITSSSSSGFGNPGSSFVQGPIGANVATHAPSVAGNVVTQAPPSGGKPGNFIPSGNNIGGFLPIGNFEKPATSTKCEATADWRIRYIWADNWCEAQCAAGNCPPQYCQDGCRQVYGK